MEFDTVKFDKEKAINCFRATAKLRQFFEVLLLLGLISWSSARVPALFRTAASFTIELSTYLFNHHVVFLIGNSIIVSLFLLCRRNDAAASPSGDDGGLYNDYVKHSEAAAAALDQREPTYDLPPPSPTPTEGGSEEEKQIVVCTEEIAVEARKCDDVAAAIEKATRQIKRFQRTQSEKLKREIRATAPQRALRRSETENRRNSVSCGERFDAEEMERLSSEEFRRTVDAFIDENWCRRKTKQNRFEFDEYEKYQLLKMA